MVAVTRRIEIDLGDQTLTLLEEGRRPLRFPVSSAANGPGEEAGSGCTPRGLHAIRLCIGDGEPVNRVFVGRRPTTEIYSPELARRWPDRDWILTRILWLTGREPGRNRGGSRDTLRRFIYIHGCPDSEPMGVPRSHGCIRMRNADLLQLFPLVGAGMEVRIREG
ncbi:MAG TPA: L,D-transpeptidase [Sedimenticola thiotaurini]|uniref:L,D-transpeptidase n=1 Tax=Sedimenticola thiotaurini TaxID=1543721 RepID=A0A831RKR0_9GAMM|nr:L,D-transpeptidase [Sedimenticola thiotaurini]